MGYRTVVMLSNDESYLWEKDPELGKKISIASAKCNSRRESNVSFDGGSVVQCVHGDVKTIALLDGYDMFTPMANGVFSTTVSEEDLTVELLRAAADKLGFRLVKKAKSK